nr:toll/interleukin-1 receptor domain-containing adapter protein isoform X3 [Macaca fascicularis]
MLLPSTQVKQVWGMLRSLLPKVLHGVHQHLKSSKKWEAKASLSLRTSEPLAYTKLFAAALQQHNAHVGSLLRGAKKALWHEGGFPSSSASTRVWDRSWWPLRPAFPAAARVRPPTLQPRTPLAVCDFWKSRSISPSFMFLDCIKGKRYEHAPCRVLGGLNGWNRVVFFLLLSHLEQNPGFRLSRRAPGNPGHKLLSELLRTAPTQLAWRTGARSHTEARLAGARAAVDTGAAPPRVSRSPIVPQRLPGLDWAGPRGRGGAAGGASGERGLRAAGPRGARAARVATGPAHRSADTQLTLFISWDPRSWSKAGNRKPTQGLGFPQM